MQLRHNIAILNFLSSIYLKLEQTGCHGNSLNTERFQYVVLGLIRIIASMQIIPPLPQSRYGQTFVRTDSMGYQIL